MDLLGRDLAAWIDARGESMASSTARKNCAELFTSLAMESVAQNTVRVRGRASGDREVPTVLIMGIVIAAVMKSG